MKWQGSFFLKVSNPPAVHPAGQVQRRVRYRELDLRSGLRCEVLILAGTCACPGLEIPPEL